MTHTPFVSNPCPATAIVFVSQNLFYGQLPQGTLFFCRLAPVWPELHGASARRSTDEIFQRNFTKYDIKSMKLTIIYNNSEETVALLKKWE